ncbi:AzlD domain-containing protein [Trujillonella humicola]|uniref:AzlD domain-containing protein n=1 Tax=Trujillonella humicola TaxID=3383699 RepID=UPI003905CD72
MTALLACTGAALATWLLRILLIALVPATRLPGPVQRALPHVGPAVLAALVAAALVGAPAGAGTDFVLAAALTAGVARRTGSVALATTAGLGSVALLGVL